MTDFLRLLILVPLGYFAAVAAAAMTIVVTALNVVLETSGTDSLYAASVTMAYQLGPVGALIVSVFIFTVLVGAMSFVPSLIAIIVAEAFRLRSVFYYVLLAGLLGYILHQILFFAGPADLFDQRAIAFPAAGFVGGFVYWLIAGRLAGVDRGEPQAGT